MDGLLLDSERLARDAFIQACTELGWEPDLDAYLRCIGSTYEKTEEILVQAHGPDFPYREVDERWSAHYHARLAEGPVPVKAGAVELLTYLERRQVPVALVTSTRRATALEKLERTELVGYFAHLVCGGETTLGKPNPDPYLAAASGLDLQATSCWALEDSANGVRAAFAAGCTVYQVPDLVTPSDEILALGHRIVESLHVVLGELQMLD